MNKEKISLQEVVDLLASRASVSKRAAEEFLKVLFVSIEEALLAGDVVKIKNFGTFKLIWNEPRKSVNIQTGEEILLAGYHKASFTPDGILKDLINEPFAHLKPVQLDDGEDQLTEDDQTDVALDPLRIFTEQASEIKNLISEIQALSSTKLLIDNDNRYLKSNTIDENADGVQITEDSTVDKELKINNELELARELELSKELELVRELERIKELELAKELEQVKALEVAIAIEQAKELELDKEIDRVKELERIKELERAKELELTIELEQVKELEHAIKLEQAKEQELSKELALAKQISQTKELELANELKAARQLVAKTNESEIVTNKPIPEVITYAEPALSASVQEEPEQSVETSNPFLKNAKPQKKSKRSLQILVVLLILLVVSFAGFVFFYPPANEMVNNTLISTQKGTKEAISTISNWFNPAPQKSQQIVIVPKDLITEDSLSVSEPIDSLQLLFDTPRVYPEFIATERIHRGSRLTRMAKRYYGTADFWVYIYEANMNHLHNPDNIPTGTLIRIPKVDSRLIDASNPRCINKARELHDLYVPKR